MGEPVKSNEASPPAGEGRRRWRDLLRSARIRAALLRCARNYSDDLQDAEDLVHDLVLRVLERPPTGRIRRIIRYLCERLRRMAANERARE
ncbi:MAG: sigma factor, partial [Longimicrobiales bacterium]|nr:sigma factor [Longimicrobiales bacterium]